MLLRKFASAIRLPRQIGEIPKMPWQKPWQLLSAEANFNACLCVNVLLLKKTNLIWYFLELLHQIQQYEQNLKAVSTTFLLVCLVSLKESTCETRKNVTYFTAKALFVLEIIKF